MYAVEESTKYIVASPLPAKALFPVAASAVLYIVTLVPCVMVRLDPLLLMIVIASPAEKTAFGTVTPPLEICIALPASAATKV